MNVITDTIEAPEDEISLLDIAVAIAESWRILVFGPIVVGLCVFGFLFFTQQDRYASSALLQITQGEAALLESASVVDPALEAADWVSRYGDVAEARREFLEKSLKTEKVGETEYFRVTVEDRSPESARAMLTALISELIRNSVPRDEARRALEQKLETLERSAESMRESLERLDSLYDRAVSGDTGAVPFLGEAGQSYATLISSITSTEQEILATRMALEGSVTTSDIIQAPTLEEQPLPQKKLLSAVLAAFATGVVLLLFAFVRAGFANAAQDARSAGKVERIKRAFRLKRVSDRPGRL